MTKNNQVKINFSSLIKASEFKEKSRHFFSFVIVVIFIGQTYGQQMKIETSSNSGSVDFVQKKDNRIYLEVSYKEDKFLMLVDSYTNFSQLPENLVVDKWKLEKTKYRYSTRDYNNIRQKTRLRLMDTISIADTFFASNFYVMPNKSFNDYNIQFGLLGGDFLNDLNWMVDFKNSKLFFDKITFDISDVSIKNKFKKTEFPWLTLQVGHIKHKVIIDLGAHKEISLPTESELGKWLIENFYLTPKQQKSGGGNKLNVNDAIYQIHLDSIYIQGIPILDVNIEISENTKVSYIGCGLLKKGILYLNYNNKKTDNCEVGFAIEK